MKKLLSWVMVGAAVLSSNLFSKTEANFGMDYGYRVEDASWQSGLAGDFSGAEFENLNSMFLAWNFGVNFDGLVIRADFDFGWLIDSGNNRQWSVPSGTSYLEASNRARGDYLDVSTAIGMQIPFGSGKFVVTPLFGYEYNFQNFRNIEAGYTANDVLSNASVKYPGYYHPRWNTLWGGVDFDIAFTEKCHLDLEFQYHWGYYFARADLPAMAGLTLEDFELRAHGWGPELRACFDYALFKDWSVGFEYKFRSWDTGQGSTTAKVSASGGIQREVHDTFLSAAWKSNEAKVKVNYVF